MLLVSLVGTACIFVTQLTKYHIQLQPDLQYKSNYKCGPMPNVMAALSNIGGALCSMPQSLADAH